MNFKKTKIKQPIITELICEVERFKKHLADIPCPSCGEKTLKTAEYEQGPKGWTAKLLCTSCLTTGSMGYDGFNIKFCEKKKVDEEAKKK